MAAHQASLSLGFSRQEHWSGLPFPSPIHESEKWKWICSVVSDSSQPHGLQPTRLLCPWDFLGKSTGVWCPSILLKSGQYFQSCGVLGRRYSLSREYFLSVESQMKYPNCVKDKWKWIWLILIEIYLSAKYCRGETAICCPRYINCDSRLSM